MKTSNNKHLIDLILSSPRIKLSQSENIILGYRDTKESIVDFVYALKRNKTDFPDIYFTILEATQIPPKQECQSERSEKVSLNRLYSRGRSAYGSVRYLSKTSGLSKKKVEQYLQTKSSYTKFGPPIRRFRRLQAFFFAIYK